MTKSHSKMIEKLSADRLESATRDSEKKRIKDINQIMRDKFKNNPQNFNPCTDGVHCDYS